MGDEALNISDYRHIRIVHSAHMVDGLSHHQLTNRAYFEDLASLAKCMPAK